jgi:hypothetical protein
MKSDLFRFIFKSFILIIVLLTIHQNILHAQDLTPQEKSIKLIADGDEFAEIKFENQNALDKYLESLIINPKDYEAYW